MRKSLLASALLAFTLVLTGCSSDDVDKAAEGVGLQAGDDGASESEAPPTAPLPEAPIDSLVEDLTTPEGTAEAYMNYLVVGKGADVCKLFTDAAISRFFTTRESCVAYVNGYSESVRATLQDSLNVAENLAVRVNSSNATTADVGIAVKANVKDGTMYYDGLILSKQGEEWRIEASKGISPVEQSDDSKG